MVYLPLHECTVSDPDVADVAALPAAAFEARHERLAEMISRERVRGSSALR